MESRSANANIPLPFATAGIGLCLSYFFHNYLNAPASTVTGFLVGVLALYLSGRRTDEGYASPQQGPDQLLGSQLRYSRALEDIRRSTEPSVIHLSGRLTLSEGSGALRRAIKEALAKDSKSILLDLTDVKYIDSFGLGELINAYNSAKRHGSELKLLGLPARIQTLLRLITRSKYASEEKAGDIDVKPGQRVR